ncbi:hypothetical protein [Methanimicrococcus hongohii]|nr:hypothetical protein [Methanimicrococcus sp. Hf6]
MEILSRTKIKTKISQLFQLLSTSYNCRFCNCLLLLLPIRFVLPRVSAL